MYMKVEMIRRTRPCRKQNRGMTLLEVMVAVVILGFGLLGLAGMQVQSMAMNQSAYYRSIATDLGNDLSDRIRAIRTPFRVTSGATVTPGKPPDFSKCSYDAAAPATPNCADQDLDRNTYQTLVNSEMTQWVGVLRAQLPNARYTLAQVASTSTDYLRYTLTITWLDNRKDNTDTSFTVVIE
jgi:type IV pilus assembly protein PilV